MAYRRFIEYIIKDGDRFDLLAYKFWGDCNYAPLLVVDNQHISAGQYAGLTAGQTMYIRENLDEEDIEVLKNDTLPFWKR